MLKQAQLSGRQARARFDFTLPPAVVEDSQIEEISCDETDAIPLRGSHRGNEGLELTTAQTRNPISAQVSTVIPRRGVGSMPGLGVDVTDGKGSSLQHQQLNLPRPTITTGMYCVEDSQGDTEQFPTLTRQDFNQQDLSARASSDASNVTFPDGEHLDLELDETTAQNTASNAQGNRSNTKVARKRSIITAGLGGPDEIQGPRKLTRSSSRLNEPNVLPDSQSSGPAPSQTSRPTKMSTTKKKGKFRPPYYEKLSVTDTSGSKRVVEYQKTFDKHRQPSGVIADR